jgi:N-carbamoyl-L-amino-acid hydrolase
MSALPYPVAVCAASSRSEISIATTELSSKRGVDLVVEWLNDQAPVRAHEKVQDTIARAADDLSFTWEAIPSGAGHDAAHLAYLGPWE